MLKENVIKKIYRSVVQAKSEQIISLLSILLLYMQLEKKRITSNTINYNFKSACWVYGLLTEREITEFWSSPLICY